VGRRERVPKVSLHVFGNRLHPLAADTWASTLGIVRKRNLFGSVSGLATIRPESIRASQKPVAGQRAISTHSRLHGHEDERFRRDMLKASTRMARPNYANG